MLNRKNHKIMTDADRTVRSLRKINPFPFYAARYYGDYRIREFMGGALKSPADVVPFFQDLFAALGKPAELSFPMSLGGGAGCSAFFCRTGTARSLVGKNLDWKRAPVLLLKTRPVGAYASLSLVNLDFCDIFGLDSFVHNLLMAPYVPLDGINEKGLVVSMLSVEEGASYPREEGKADVGDFNIIRCILDSCAGVDEGINLFRKYNLMQTSPLPLHYLLADENDSAIVEFFGGEMHVRTSGERSYLTNFLVLNDGIRERRKGECHRYGELMKDLESGREIDRAEGERILRKVSLFTGDFQIPSTIWSVIYRPDERAMHLKVGANTPYFRAGLGKGSP
jgi:hypothetical protein